MVTICGAQLFNGFCVSAEPYNYVDV